MSDVMCHSVEVGRFLLTGPDEDRSAMQVKSVNDTIGFLKWAREHYAKQIAARSNTLDYRNSPSEDFARAYDF